MVANFDTAMDARYAIAQGGLWSTVLHPFAALTVDEFLSGFTQAVTLAGTYRTTYCSGALRFSGGDGVDK